MVSMINVLYHGKSKIMYQCIWRNDWKDVYVLESMGIFLHSLMQDFFWWRIPQHIWYTFSDSKGGVNCCCSKVENVEYLKPTQEKVEIMNFDCETILFLTGSLKYWLVLKLYLI